MIEPILNAATNFDWISPTVYILQDFWNRPVSRFGLDANAGFDRRDIRRILQGSGIRVWGFVYNVAGDMIMISVPKAQAAGAGYVLMEAGVPVVVGPPELAQSEPAKKRGPVSWLLGW